MSCCIFIFTRDIRGEDNTGLNYALKNYKKVIPIFIFLDYFISNKNEYFSENAFSFLTDELEKVNFINIMYSKNNFGEDLITEIVKKCKADALFINMDYTPFAKKREKTYEKMSLELGIKFKTFNDVLLVETPVKNIKSGKPFIKFSAFYRNINFKIREPEILQFEKSNFKNYIVISLVGNNGKRCKKQVYNEKYIEDYVLNYNTAKNILKSSKLSRFIKFGIFSPRQLYHHYKNNKDFIRQLLWRDFYYSYYYDNEASLENGDSNFTLSKIKWKVNENYLDKWMNGNTGIPIVDAGMRELNQTGFMHNRLRMITASLLTKNLGISWKQGEKYFSQKLFDIDRIINSGNWQNIAGVAKHSQPYFRVFNPWLQSKKFDKNCEYIKKWVPELGDVPNKDIHIWYSSYKKYSDIKYHKPMIDVSLTSRQYIDQFST